MNNENTKIKGRTNASHAPFFSQMTDKRPKMEKKKKREKYEHFKAQCKKENPDDPRLNREVTPIVFETYGAAGPTVLEHMSLTRHQYGNIVLPCEDRSSESIFHSKLAYELELSTSLHIGPG